MKRRTSCARRFPTCVPHSAATAGFRSPAKSPNSHEETLRFTLEEAEAYFAETAPRGEFVLILEGAAAEIEAETEDERMTRALAAVQQRIDAGETLKDAVKTVSAEIGVKKNALYQAALNAQE